MTMNRIVNHHTGGAYTPSAKDRDHYHTIIDGEAAIHAGKHPIEANAPGKKLVSGKYAAHTLNLNSGAIGNAVAAMAGGQWGSPMGCGTFPKPAQMEALVQLNARQCVEYGIAVTRETVLSHGEVEPTLRITQRGKWDFDYDPWHEVVGRDPVEIGDNFRTRVKAAIEGRGQPILEPTALRETLRRGSRGDLVAEMQRHLNRHGATLSSDGQFGPGCWAALVAFQKKHQLVPDGVCGRMTWAALLANT